MRDLDFHWFLDNYQDLYQQYGKSYLLIKDQQVVSPFDSFRVAVDEGAKRFGMGSFIVQYCNGDESAYTNYISSMNFAV